MKLRNLAKLPARDAIRWPQPETWSRCIAERITWGLKSPVLRLTTPLSWICHNKKNGHTDEIGRINPLETIGNLTKTLWTQREPTHGFELWNKNHFPSSPLKWTSSWWWARCRWAGIAGTTQWGWIAIAISMVTARLQWHPGKPTLRRPRPVCHFSSQIPSSKPVGNEGSKVIKCTGLTSPCFR